MGYVENPILRGSNPDPSIIRVDKEYFIAVSTFEWFPGVLIYHSRDLVNWNLVARPLNRVNQLDLIGVPDSCGVGSACLSYDNGIFYLVYSTVKSFDGPLKDTTHYLVTTENITGEWSDPIFLSTSGIDASLFHESTGKKWLVSMTVHPNKEKLFGGIVLQEYDHEKKQLVGEIHHLTDGTALGNTEAPQLYEKDGYYYLLLAEGGTDDRHAATMMRSKSLTGPYETHPHNPWITASHEPVHPIQKCGHADIIESDSGEWHVVFSTARPLSERGKCITGRETAIEKMVWKEGWPYLDTEDKLPRQRVWFDNAEEIYQGQTSIYNFNTEKLSLDLQSLRVPITNDWCSTTDRKGYLRLYGRESLSSLQNQSMVARRVTEHHSRVITILDYQPKHDQQMAGLVMYYKTGHWHYLYISTDDKGKRVLQILSCDNNKINKSPSVPIALSETNDIVLRSEWHAQTIQCYYQDGSNEWKEAGHPLDGSILSDDYVFEGTDHYRPALTGAFVGMCCQDLSGERLYADFKVFIYENLEKPRT